MTVCEIDLRVGGTWRYVMVTPDGLEVGFHGEYREIVPNERLVSTEVYEGIPDAEEQAALDTLTLTEATGARPSRSSSSTRRRKVATCTSTPAWRTACRTRWICSRRSRSRSAESAALRNGEAPLARGFSVAGL